MTQPSFGGPTDGLPVAWLSAIWLLPCHGRGRGRKLAPSRRWPVRWLGRALAALVLAAWPLLPAPASAQGEEQILDYRVEAAPGKRGRLAVVATVALVAGATALQPVRVRAHRRGRQVRRAGVRVPQARAWRPGGGSTSAGVPCRSGGPPRRAVWYGSLRSWLDIHGLSELNTANLPLPLSSVVYGHHQSVPPGVRACTADPSRHRYRLSRSSGGGHRTIPPRPRTAPGHRRRRSRRRTRRSTPRTGRRRR
jgi:hypothetical protein